MSTELAVIEKENFVALSMDDDLREAMGAMKGTGEEMQSSDLIRVKTPSGGGTSWEVDGPTGVEHEDEIKGILVAVQIRGVLWPSDEMQDNAKPVLVSHDLVTAEQIGDIPDEMIDSLEPHRIGDTNTFRWKDLPYNEFGSGKNGIGKRCKEQRVLFILREGDMFPLVVTAQPGSLKAVRKFLIHLPQAAKVPYWRCIVSLSLKCEKNKSGINYSQIDPKLIGTISREDGAVVKKEITDTLTKIEREIDVAE